MKCPRCKGRGVDPSMYDIDYNGNKVGEPCMLCNGKKEITSDEMVKELERRIKVHEKRWDGLRQSLKRLIQERKDEGGWGDQQQTYEIIDVMDIIERRIPMEEYE